MPVVRRRLAAGGATTGWSQRSGLPPWQRSHRRIPGANCPSPWVLFCFLFFFFFQPCRRVARRAKQPLAASSPGLAMPLLVPGPGTTLLRALASSMPPGRQQQPRERAEAAGQAKPGSRGAIGLRSTSLARDAGDPSPLPGHLSPQRRPGKPENGQAFRSTLALGTLPRQGHFAKAERPSCLVDGRGFVRRGHHVETALSSGAGRTDRNAAHVFDFSGRLVSRAGPLGHCGGEGCRDGDGEFRPRRRSRFHRHGCQICAGSMACLSDLVGRAQPVRSHRAPSDSSGQLSSHAHES